MHGFPEHDVFKTHVLLIFIVNYPSFRGSLSLLWERCVAEPQEAHT